MSSFDVIVLGVGGMGSAACYHLAKRGARVLGLEQFEIAHAKGSSHGDVRLIRQAYFEEVKYVPLLKRSYQLWNELEKEAGQTLFHPVGLLIMGPPSGGMALPGVLGASEQYDIPVELLDSVAIGKRFSQFRLNPEYRGVLEPGAGYLEVEKCVAAHVKRAIELGAEIHAGEMISDWKAQPNQVEVITEQATYRAQKLVITAGPWTSGLLSELGMPLRVLRVPQFWFKPSGGFEETPCFAFDRPDGFFYGFPPREGWGLKLAEYKPREVLVADPLRVDRVITEGDSALLSQCVRQNLPGVASAPVKGTVCMYTMTPDENFIVDFHPEHRNVVFAGGFSGHGFKFASIMGEVLSELALDGETGADIEFLRLRRFFN